jgi:predicted XRE-type DNA-binding protein
LHCFDKKSRKTPKKRSKNGSCQVENAQAGVVAGRKPMINKGLKRKTVQGNIFAALGFESEEALDLKLRSDLLMIIHRIILKYDARQLQQILGEHQPRISELMNGKLDKLSLNRLVRYAAKLGQSVEIRAKRGKAAA